MSPTAKRNENDKIAAERCESVLLDFLDTIEFALAQGLSVRWDKTRHIDGDFVSITIRRFFKRNSKLIATYTYQTREK